MFATHSDGGYRELGIQAEGVDQLIVSTNDIGIYVHNIAVRLNT